MFINDKQCNRGSISSHVKFQSNETRPVQLLLVDVWSLPGDCSPSLYSIQKSLKIIDFGDFVTRFNVHADHDSYISSEIPLSHQHSGSLLMNSG